MRKERQEGQGRHFEVRLNRWFAALEGSKIGRALAYGVIPALVLVLVYSHVRSEIETWLINRENLRQ